MTWDCECGAGDISRAMPDVSWGAVSLQLRALIDAGAIVARADGRHRYYRADRDRLAGVSDMLQAMWNDSLWRLKLAAELDATRRGPPPSPRLPPSLKLRRTGRRGRPIAKAKAGRRRT